MTYTLYYVSEDAGHSGWSVYSEEYETIDSPEPIDGRGALIVSGLPTEQDADDRARHYQERSYAGDYRG